MVWKLVLLAWFGSFMLHKREGWNLPMADMGLKVPNVMDLDPPKVHIDHAIVRGDPAWFAQLLKNQVMTSLTSHVQSPKTNGWNLQKLVVWFRWCSGFQRGDGFRLQCFVSFREGRGSSFFENTRTSGRQSSRPKTTKPTLFSGVYVGFRDVLGVCMNIYHIYIFFFYYVTYIHIQIYTCCCSSTMHVFVQQSSKKFFELQIPSEKPSFF